MTKQDHATLACLAAQFRSIQNAEDSFYKLAQQKGWLKNDELKRALFGHQHRVSSTIHNATASIRIAQEKGREL